MSKDDLYKEKEHKYYSNIRWDIIDLIPEGPHKVLEVGCGTGSTLVKLKPELPIHKRIGYTDQRTLCYSF